MASVKPNLIIGISGTVNGIEFAMTKSGIIAKRRKPSRQMNSRREIAALTVFQRRSAKWHTLGPDKVIAWQNWANGHPVRNRLGQQLRLTGYQWFMKLRHVDDPTVPPIDTTDPPTAIVITPDGGFWLKMDDNTSTPVVRDSFQGEGRVSVTIEADVPAPGTMWVDLWYSIQIGTQQTPKGGSWIYVGQFVLDESTFINSDTLQAAGAPWLQHAIIGIKVKITRTGYWPSRMTYEFASTIPGAQDQTFTDPTGDPNTDAHSVSGVHGTALYFDGVDDCILLTEACIVPYLAANTDFTLAIWWKPDAPIGGVYQTFLGNNAFLGEHFNFSIKNNNSQIVVRTLHAAAYHTYSKTWNETDVSVWRHWALVRRGETLMFYRDGVMGYSVTAAGVVGTITGSNTDVAIGRRGVGSDYAAGAAEDVRLFSRALTTTEVARVAVP